MLLLSLSLVCLTALRDTIAKWPFYEQR